MAVLILRKKLKCKKRGDGMDRAWGVPLYAEREDIVASVVYVQKMWDIASRRGRRMFHETVTITAYELEYIGRD